jgi:PilZ domain
MTAPVASDRPEASTSADLTLVTKGITITASVERADEFALVVRPTAAAHAREVGVKPGDPVELYWRADYEERTLPAKIAEIEDGEIPVWRLAATGPAERSQRRKAVRAWVSLPLTVTCNSTQLTGETVDVSEAGVRALVDGWGLPPDRGTPAQVTITLEQGFVDARATVVRATVRGVQWELAMQLEGISEKDQDRLRQRVFRALREERSRTVE